MNKELAWLVVKNPKDYSLDDLRCAIKFLGVGGMCPPKEEEQNDD